MAVPDEMDLSCLLQKSFLDVHGSLPVHQEVECSLRRQLALFTLPGSIMIFLLMLLRSYSLRSESADTARAVGLFIQFVHMMSFSVIILDSYDLLLSMGHGATESGRLIGIYMAGCAVGGVLMWLLLRASPSLWQKYGRPMLMVATLTNTCSVLIYAYITSKVGRHVGITSHEELLMFLLMLTRFMSGIGHGLCAQLMQVTFAHLTSPPERPKKMALFFFANTLGVAVGPLIAGVLRFLDPCNSRQMSFWVAAVVQLLLTVSALLAAARVYPPLKDCVDFVRSAEAEAAGAEELTRRRIVVCGCLTMALLRALVTAGVEGATSYLLEAVYQWETYEVGICVGAILLCTLPAKLLLDLFERTSVALKIRIMSVVALAGCVGLLLGGSSFLILADILIFPTLYLSDGLNRGIMQQSALPTGSLLDQNHTTLWGILLANGVGRFLGPWLSRGIIEAATQKAYAIAQFVMTCFFWGAFEFLVMRFQPRAAGDGAERAIETSRDGAVEKGEDRRPTWLASRLFGAQN